MFSEEVGVVRAAEKLERKNGRSGEEKWVLTGIAGRVAALTV